MKYQTIAELARMKASFFIGMTVIFGMVVAGNKVDIFRLILGFMVGFFLSASTNTLNDISDVEIDIIEKPDRPIPRGDITIKESKFLVILETLVALMIAFYLNIYAFILSVLVSFLSLLYSWNLKNIVIVKNILTSFGASSAFLVGIFAEVGFSLNSENILFYLLAFITIITFELHKDIADVEGDVKGNKRTVPVVWGTKTAAIITILLYILCFGLYQIIFLILTLNLVLLLIFDIIIIISSVYVFPILKYHENSQYIHRSRKVTMTILGFLLLTLIFNLIIKIP